MLPAWKKHIFIWIDLPLGERTMNNNFNWVGNEPCAQKVIVLKAPQTRCFKTIQRDPMIIFIFATATTYVAMNPVASCSDFARSRQSSFAALSHGGVTEMSRVDFANWTHLNCIEQKKQGTRLCACMMCWWSFSLPVFADHQKHSAQLAQLQFQWLTGVPNHNCTRNGRS